MWRLRRGQTEHAVLARPFGREFAKTRDTHSIGQATFDGRLDEVGCKKRERDRHVDLAQTASTGSDATVHGEAIAWRLLPFLHAIITHDFSDPQAVVGENLSATFGLRNPMGC